MEVVVSSRLLGVSGRIDYVYASRPQRISEANLSFPASATVLFLCCLLFSVYHALANWESSSDVGLTVVMLLLSFGVCMVVVLVSLFE
jgi:hypothetical protein